MNDININFSENVVFFKMIFQKTSGLNQREDIQLYFCMDITHKVS